MDIAWKDGKANSVVIKAMYDGQQKILAPHGQQIATLNPPVPATSIDDRMLGVHLKAGQTCQVKFK